MRRHLAIVAACLLPQFGSQALSELPVTISPSAKRAFKDVNGEHIVYLVDTGIIDKSFVYPSYFSILTTSLPSAVDWMGDSSKLPTSGLASLYADVKKVDPEVGLAVFAVKLSPKQMQIYAAVPAAHLKRVAADPQNVTEGSSKDIAELKSVNSIDVLKYSIDLAFKAKQLIDNVSRSAGAVGASKLARIDVVIQGKDTQTVRRLASTFKASGLIPQGNIAPNFNRLTITYKILADRESISKSIIGLCDFANTKDMVCIDYGINFSAGTIVPNADK